MKEGFWYRVSLRVIPFIFVWLTRIWFASCRVAFHDQKYMDRYKGVGIPIIASCWHYGIFFNLYLFRNESGVAMVSASRDGEYISRVVERLGNETVRGSRKKGGMQAIIKLIRAVREGKNAILVADGSQGPARVTQAGSILLAARTEAPILPLAWSCSRYKRFGSWDGTVLPLPFSKIEFFYGEPLQVPSGLDDKKLEEYRQELENRLNDLYARAWALQGKTEH